MKSLAQAAYYLRTNIFDILQRVEAVDGIDSEWCSSATDEEIMIYALFLTWRCPDFWGSLPQTLQLPNGYRGGEVDTDQLYTNLRAEVQPFRADFQY